MTSTDDGIGPPTAPRESHEHYMRSVADELGERGLEVADLEIRDGASRQALMRVTEADPVGTVWTDSDWLRLRWDEHYGWSWQVRYLGETQPRGAVYFGVSAVPPPAAIADWMFVSLTHPEAEPSREHGPFNTPDIDVVLRAYTPTTG